MLKVGTHATLLGDRHPINPESLAESLGTINYEVVTRINPMIPRIVTT